AMLAAIRREDKILAIVEKHGFASLESNGATALHDAIAGLSDRSRDTSPVALTILGMSASLVNQLDLAEARFKQALAACRDDVQRRGVAFWYACDLIRRGRAEAIELLEAGDAPAGLSTFVRVASQSALAAAYAMTGQDQAAVARIAPLLKTVEALDDEMLRARVYHQAAYVELRGCRYAQATALANKAIALAERVGAYETVAGAVSVLHNVAINVDEDLEHAIEHLRRIAECGAKCGSVEKQLYALANAYEIQVERGDEIAATRLEEELRAFDVAYGTRATDEAVLPAQVLQLTWRGEFGRAYAILKSSGDQQGDAGRRSLRWSEISLYAAAAGARGDALSAIQRAHTQLESAPSSDGHTWRARAYLALTSLLLGRMRGAQSEISAIGTQISEAPERLRMLVDFVAQLTALQSGESTQFSVLQGLERMYDRGLGGFARMLEALPGDLLAIGPSDSGKAQIA
ncbi:MAG: hypothetical protein JOY59_05175, partial [Candidatus Eremiobacteraeota bacterium]|nr:hypothetical protein [Candidatus Eremiobacteraeota bacterium]